MSDERPNILHSLHFHYRSGAMVGDKVGPREDFDRDIRSLRLEADVCSVSMHLKFRVKGDLAEDFPLCGYKAFIKRRSRVKPEGRLRGAKHPSWLHVLDVANLAPHGRARGGGIGHKLYSSQPNERRRVEEVEEAGERWENSEVIVHEGEGITAFRNESFYA